MDRLMHSDNDQQVCCPTRGQQPAGHFLDACSIALTQQDLEGQHTCQPFFGCLLYCFNTTRFRSMHESSMTCICAIRKFCTCKVGH